MLWLACTYVLAGPWAFTPALARESLPREIAIEAVPSKHLTVARDARLDELPGASRDAGARHDSRGHGAPGLPAPSRAWWSSAPVSNGRLRASAGGEVPRQPGNRAPYDATAPPPAR